MPSARAMKYLPPRVADQIAASALPRAGRCREASRDSTGRPISGPRSSCGIPRLRRGDAPNLIDWQVFAKTDRYMIRRFQDETSLRACVLVDASASLHFRQTGPVTKFEYACSLAAGLMYLLAARAMPRRFFFTDRVTQRFARSPARRRWSRPSRMEKVEAAGAGNIEKSLHEAAEMLKQRSLVIVISDLLQPPPSSRAASSISSTTATT